MIMKTLVEKARAYDKAIEKIKYVMEHGVQPVLTKEDLQSIFPEIFEPEDERIRKEIISHLQHEYVVKRYVSDVEYDRWIAWLEKQGNVNALIQEAAEKSYTEGMRVERKRWIEKLGYKPQGKTALEAIKEEKSPVESLGISPEKYEEIVNECIYGKTISDDKKELASSAKTCKNDTLLDLLNKMPSCISVDGIDYHFVMKKTSIYIAYYACYKGNGEEGGMFRQFKRWRPVRDVLDLADEGESIFTKKKPLCEKTQERIYAGLVKFVAGGKEQAEAWILKYNSTNREGHHNPPGIDEPCPVVAVQNRLGLVKCRFLSKQFSGDPMSKNQSIDQPAGTVTTVDHHAFVTAYYGNGYNSSIDSPAPTVTTKDRISLVTTKFMDNQYGRSKPSSIDGPAPTLLNNPKQKIVSAQYLMNPYSFKSDGGSIDKPCFTLIARMDKMPPYLISTDEGIGIKIFDDDTHMTRKVKEFMAAYGIIDIKMRMLKIAELKRIMGFPENYTLIGTQAEQKKFIGNAVEVNMSRVLCEALSKRLKK